MKDTVLLRARGEIEAASHAAIIDPSGRPHARGPFEAFRVSRPSRRLAILACTVVACLFQDPALAQYAFDPSNADEQAKPGTLYFGSAKDEDGRSIGDVTIVLEGQQTSFVLITSPVGRFRGKFLIDAPAKDIKAACSKPGYSLLRVSKRLSRPGAAPSVQIDCILGRLAAR